MVTINTDKPIMVNGKSRKWVLIDYSKRAYFHYIKAIRGYYVLDQGKLKFIESNKKLEDYEIFNSPTKELLHPALDEDKIKTAIQENEDV